MSDLAHIRIDYVDTHEFRKVVSAAITHHGGTRFRAGHLPGEGWFCSCSRAKRCPHLRTLQDLIPGIAPPTTAAPPQPAPTPEPDGVPRE